MNALTAHRLLAQPEVRIARFLSEAATSLFFSRADKMRKAVDKQWQSNYIIF